ncbi:protein ORF85 [Cyprinid herpesvirus 1]|uniref:Protein ORF85 n=1 Tax=Cyprinid herpesvirus 1 TaxID=317858 RepID=K7PC85_9VIRU|nr:protein ORF85 [Cyprinid herpesvirus 1]AFJ20382.1 protein ORF85 [Cyprinid herpesvirus 1]
MEPVKDISQREELILLENLDKMCEFLDGEFGPPVIINEFPLAFVQAYGVIHVVDLEGPDEATEEARRVLLVAVSQHAHWRHHYSQEMESAVNAPSTKARIVRANLLLGRQSYDKDEPASLLNYFSLILGHEMARKIVPLPPLIGFTRHDKASETLLLAALDAWRTFGQLLFAEVCVGAYQKYLSTISEQEFKGVNCVTLAGMGADTQQKAVVHFTLMRRQVEAWKHLALTAFRVCLGTYYSAWHTTEMLLKTYQLLTGQEAPKGLTMESLPDWVSGMRPDTESVGMFFFANLRKNPAAGETKKQEQDWDYHEDVWALFSLFSTMTPKSASTVCRINAPGVTRMQYLYSCFAQYKGMYGWAAARRPEIAQRFCKILKFTPKELEAVISSASTNPTTTTTDGSVC